MEIKPFQIPVDAKSPEKEKSLARSNAVLGKIKKSKVGQFFNKIINNPSIRAVARKLTESVEDDNKTLQILQTLDPEKFGKYKTFL